MANNPYRSKTSAKPYKSKTAAKPYKSKSGTSTRANAKSTINKLSGFLLGTNKVLRDINAVQKGTIMDRVGRRVAGSATSQGLGGIFKSFKTK